MPFGQSLPVVALNNGFLGNPSRFGKRTITARQVLSTTPNPIKFGDPCVIIPNSSGGGDTVQSVADFIAGGGTFTAAKFAGIAVREVKSNLNLFTNMENVDSGGFVGSYAPGEIAEIMEEGSLTVLVNTTNGAAVSQAPIYIRVVAHAPNNAVGDIESVADATGADTVQIPGVLFRTGNVDGNGVAEITMLNRVSA